MLDDSFFNPVYFIEDNLLPFDPTLQDLIINYCSQNDLKTQKVKSVYYENRNDFEAYQHINVFATAVSPIKLELLDMPNLDHCASPEFCFESYLDYEKALNIQIYL